MGEDDTTGTEAPPAQEPQAAPDLSDKLINPATIKGAALVAAGTFVLAFPEASSFVIRLVVAFALIFTGLTDVWAEIKAPKTSWRSLGVGLVSVVAGLIVLAFAREAISFIIVVGGILMVVRGVILFFGGISARHAESSWLFDLIRGLVYVAVGLILIFLPAALVGTVLVVGGMAAVALGGVVIHYGYTNAADPNLGGGELGGIIVRWFKQRDVGDDMRIDVIDNLYFEEPDARLKRTGWWILLILSVVIATLGVLADSTAVVIGAMLVAPLMTPIMGVAAAIVNGWTRRVTISFLTVVAGVAVAIAVAWIVATWAPQLVPHPSNSQIQSRINPTLIDMMIAIAAGAAGAYATVDKRVSSSITGVAIAVALVPPLGVVGVMMQAGLWDDALGAFLLFATNLVSIILVASIVFLMAGLAPWEEFKENREKVRTVVATVVLGAFIIIVPLAFTSEGIIASASRQSTTQETTELWLVDSEDLSLAKVSITGSDVMIQITGEGDIPPIEDLEAALEESLGTDVSVTVEYFPTTVIVSDGS